MGYTTKNEVMNFRFADAEIFEIKGIRDKITFELGYVTILGQTVVIVIFAKWEPMH